MVKSNWEPNWEQFGQLGDPTGIWFFKLGDPTGNRKVKLGIVSPTGNRQIKLGIIFSTGGPNWEWKSQTGNGFLQLGDPTGNGRVKLGIVSPTGRPNWERVKSNWEWFVLTGRPNWETQLGNSTENGLVNWEWFDQTGNGETKLGDPTGKTQPNWGPLHLTQPNPSPAGAAVPPKVFVFPPPPEELALSETVTLTCLASGFAPRDVLITWTHLDAPVDSGKFSILGPAPDAGNSGRFSAYSKMVVGAEEWRRGDVFACVVGHDGIEMKFIQRSLDKTMARPANVNVSVVLADSDTVCY
ncbi:hypothetical protein HGM15179_019356 [Zosterops borbonicus]|uniref:Ig-like domain-containing protein n=1 Tax=Zosterops borbonicus TaxID=364589 RepID=A0A8K1D8X9_9PASS|nr:hypothetical protein HGM15179_019356 [Zosterops borbonicus]